MEDILVPILVPLITFSMPVLLCWVYYRNEMHTTSQRTEIVKAVIEKNPDLDVEELLEKINPKQKLLKEKLLSRLLWGCITGFIGLGLLIFACYAGGWTGDEINVMWYAGGWTGEEINFMWITGAISLAIGIAFMITYYVGRKMLAKEMEAETRKMEQK